MPSAAAVLGRNLLQVVVWVVALAWEVLVAGMVWRSRVSLWRVRSLARRSSACRVSVEGRRWAAWPTKRQWLRRWLLVLAVWSPTKGRRLVAPPAPGRLEGWRLVLPSSSRTEVHLSAVASCHTGSALC